ncbi:MAG: serine/threonine-protein kinase [Myxococcales bacterium]
MERSPRDLRDLAPSRPTGASGVRARVPGPPLVPSEAVALAPSNDNAAPELPEPSLPESDAPGRRSLSLPPPLAKLGRYEVLGRIAVGGMAEIFLCRDTVQSGTVRHTVLKLLRRQATNEADERYFEELFLREGRTASLLVHPNICHVYEFGKWQTDFYIAMEYIDGVSLRDVAAQLERKKIKLSPVLAAGIAAQVAGALEYAHTARDARRRPLNVVHLDVTPQNVMLRHDGAVKLLDFGVAQVSDPQADSRSDMIKGKMGYMAPEQVLQKPLDARVDVFALGVCLFEMLSGTRLFRRDNLTATLKALLKEPIPSLSKLRADVPGELDDIVQKALAREPAARFQSAGELQEALEGFLAHSQEVVSNRHVAALMANLFPEGQSDAPRLDTSPEIIERLARNEQLAEESTVRAVPEVPALPTPASHAAPQALPSTRPAGRRLWPVLALVVIVMAGLLAWTARTDSRAIEPQVAAKPPAAATPSPAAAQPAPAPVPGLTPAQPAPEPRTTAPEAPVAAAPEPRVAEPAEVEPASPDAPVARPAPVTPAPARPRRRSSPGFVADPGF